MTSPGGEVVITQREIYDQLLANTRAVERLTDTLGPSVSRVQADLEDHADRMDDIEATLTEHGTRITEMRTQLRAAWAVAGLALTALGSVIAFLH